MLHIKKLVGMHNKETYARIYAYMCAYWHTRIRKIRSYDTRIRSSLISELHCMPQYSNMNTFHTSHESRVSVEHHRTLEVCRGECLKTWRMPQYSNMNTFHTSRESRVPVEHYRTLEVCRLEYPKTSRMPQYSNMNTWRRFTRAKRFNNTNASALRRTREMYLKLGNHFPKFALEYKNSSIALKLIGYFLYPL